MPSSLPSWSESIKSLKVQHKSRDHLLYMDRFFTAFTSGLEDRISGCSKQASLWASFTLICEIASETLLAGSNEKFDLMEKFYELPVEEKLKYDFTAEGKYFGYKWLGAGVIDRKGTRDKNEIYSVFRSQKMSYSLSLRSTPSPLNHHREARRSVELHQRHQRCLATLFASLEKSLDPPASTFTSLHRLYSPSGSHVRFIRAPPQPVDQRSLALGEHTDFGSLTILFNRIGGLQVRPPNTSE
ncbi:Clavaminate synthase-like protein [Byssothecium circinans]|uniref:Clavaminate synthase-like protein n=1 Tax=Byssothecium circinans TaxID=147558 RepID=A0A6A5U465_9PLEO|nr:Clavaminate synthase-like protein [Byssothecium circinans]